MSRGGEVSKEARVKGEAESILSTRKSSAPLFYV